MKNIPASVDLHLHTTASDGRLSPSALVRLVAEQGLEVVSISDHDTTDGLEEAFETAKHFPDLRIIPGVELGCEIPGDEVHILGYFLNYWSKDFQKRLAWYRDGRLNRCRLIVEKLGGLGMPLDWERVLEIAGDGSIGRPHIALAMVELGYCNEPRDAFALYLDKSGPAYVERPTLTPVESIELLLRVGGVPVLAHPARMNEITPVIEELKSAGLVGMEVYYGKYSKETVNELAELADHYGLIPCGGSDYHALGNSDDALPGSNGPPLSTVDRLEEIAQKLAVETK